MNDDGYPLRSSLAGVCPLCGAPLDLNSSACRRCGVTPSRIGPCPHCKSTSSARPHPDLGWVCDVCGAARLAHPALETDTTVQAPLATATRNYRSARLLRATSLAGMVLTGITVLLLFMVRALLAPGGAMPVAFAILATVLLAATVAGALRVKSLRNLASRDLEQAQIAALVKLLADFPGGAFAAQLASSMQISLARAEQLLTRLNVRDDIQSIIADDGQLLFRIRSDHSVGNLGSNPVHPPSRARVESPLPDESEPLDRTDDDQHSEQPATEKVR